MGGHGGVTGVPGGIAPLFVGRVDELEEIRRRFEHHRVVTPTGPPGVGKTRLAIQAVDELQLSAGSWFVDLHALTDPALLAQEIAGHLGVKDATTQWALDGLARRIGDAEVLLVLDNCEHLLDACAVLVDSLVRTCPHLNVLAASRQSLGIAAEAVRRMAPMPIP